MGWLWPVCSAEQRRPSCRALVKRKHMSSSELDRTWAAERLIQVTCSGKCVHGGCLCAACGEQGVLGRACSLQQGLRGPWPALPCALGCVELRLRARVKLQPSPWWSPTCGALGRLHRDTPAHISWVQGESQEWGACVAAACQGDRFTVMPAWGHQT